MENLAFGGSLLYCVGRWKRKLKIDGTELDSAEIKEAAAKIDAGGLVAFPTETVYGIACRVKGDSLEKLDNIKGRTADKYYTLHIVGREDVSNYVPTLGLRARKLIQNAWPGPLTIVFEINPEDLDRQKKKLHREVFESLYKDNSIGIRCPDNPVATALLQRTSFPVVAPSANATGQDPAVDAEQVLAQLAGKIDLLLDGGTCPGGVASTVLDLTASPPRVLRAGPLLPALDPWL